MTTATARLVLTLVVATGGALFFTGMENFAMFLAGVSLSMFIVLFARWSYRDAFTGELNVGSQVGVVIAAWTAVLGLAWFTLPAAGLVTVLAIETFAVTLVALFGKPERAWFAA